VLPQAVWWAAVPCFTLQSCDTLRELCSTSGEGCAGAVWCQAQQHSSLLEVTQGMKTGLWVGQREHLGSGLPWGWPVGHPRPGVGSFVLCVQFPHGVQLTVSLRTPTWGPLQLLLQYKRNLVVGLN